MRPVVLWMKFDDGDDWVGLCYTEAEVRMCSERDDIIAWGTAPLAFVKAGMHMGMEEEADARTD